VSGRTAKAFLVRYNPDGSHDTSFGSGGYILNAFQTNPPADGSSTAALLVQLDGKIVVAGGNGNDAGIGRYNTNGTVDTSFGTNGFIITPLGIQSGFLSSVLQADGKILTVGLASNGSYDEWALARFADVVSTNQPPSINPIPNAIISEGDTYSANGSFTDSDSTSWTATVDYGDGTATKSLSLSGTNFSLSHLYKDNGTYTVTVNVTDNQGATGTKTATITVNNVVPTVGTITVSPNPLQVNSAITASANFTDPGVLDTHTATWNWGDGNTTTGTVTETNGSGSVSDSHTYATADVYTITLTVTDKDNGQGTQTFQYVSVFNPTAQGLFSAGQHFTSPAGAYPQNSSLTGNVVFGLAYKYQGTEPVGDRQFSMNFKAANLTFNATSISSFVISNGMATLRGTGTINGSGNYNFLVTGVNGGGIRIQITDPANNNTVIYDTQPGAAATATPTTSVTGQVIVHN
jgi:uncharacterized delta-60 repeat protein